jgi:glutathione S-transferase
MRLYSGRRSPNARKVRLLAKELDLTLEIVSPDFAKGELRSPDFLALNPNGKVPVLDDNGFLLWESAAILHYLAGKRPERGLVPGDPKKRAVLDQWLFWWAAHVEPAFLRLVFERLVKPFLKLGEADASIVETADRDLARYLPILDRQLEGSDHVLGELTIADFAIAPWFESASGIGVSLEPYANVSRWLAGLAKRPYWADA